MDNNRSFSRLCGGDPRTKIDSNHNRYWRLHTCPISPNFEVIKNSSHKGLAFLLLLGGGGGELNSVVPK